MGGPGVKAAAEAALTGSDADISHFLSIEKTLRQRDDRLDGFSLLSVGGTGVREAAQTALATQNPETLRTFLLQGWQAPLARDRRVETLSVMSTSGVGVNAAGKRALEGTPEDVRTFLEDTQHAARRTDNRVQVMSLLSVGGPNVRGAATIALKGTPEDVQEFLDIGQHIARNRDQEHATVSQLAQQAKEAGAQAERSTALAKESSKSAVDQARLAKEAAQRAAKETEAARNDALKAAASAATAAEAARDAASAAKRAISAAKAANLAARVASSAAAQASAAAIGAANAATRAFGAAQDAWANEGKAADARKLADEADRAADAADMSAEALRRATDAAEASETAASAAQGAAGNALAAADEADKADDFAAAAGVNSHEARRAADEARRHANEAKRAAGAAVALARKARTAAQAAGAAATSAASHARKAAAEARRAADHAGQAAQAAAESRKHAADAKAAADTASNAVTQAQTAHKLVLETEAEDRAARTAAAIELAEDFKQETDDLQVTANQTIDNRGKADAEAARLGAEAAKPDVNVKNLAIQGRKFALTMAANRGPWAKQAAVEALGGTDEEVRDYLRTRWKRASQDDDRTLVERIADSEKEPAAVRTAATTALTKTPDQITAFLRSGQYDAARTENRVKVLQVMSVAGVSVNAAGKKALETDTPESLLGFLNRGQHEARATDERVIAMDKLSTGGTEVKAEARIALSGPPSLVHDFVQQGQFTAQYKDDLADTHNRQIERLIADASGVASKAQANAWKAAEAAALANKEEAAAKDSARKAAASAQDADDYAKAAQKSADAAATSATKAEASADTARGAAARAAQDAINAEVSAQLALRSYSWARGSAVMANQHADDAYAAAISAGKEAKAAEDAKWGAFDSYMALYRREYQARLGAEEQRLRNEAQKAKEKKEYQCVPGAAIACALFADDDQTVTFSAYTEGMMLASGIQGGIDCYNTLNIKTCAWAAVAFMPLPVGKAASLFANALRAGRAGAEGARAGSFALSVSGDAVESVALASRAGRIGALKGIVLKDGKPMGVPGAPGVQMITPGELEDAASTIRRDFGPPDEVKIVPGKGSIDVWNLEGGNVNYRNFSGSGGSMDYTIDFTGELKEILGFKRYHAKH